ncbi:MAG: glycosyltransferase family 4 protein [Desulfobacteraceae bacterium]|nr:glycosyltransferase family 4 protein [Desulfobacteraceae bacterium]MBC2753930.1 glycosyltransferase family 4 protein [Desulfobacteraceae bacterium]
MSSNRKPDKIKVVHLSNHDMGLRVHARNQLLYLKQRGYDVSMICNPGDYLKKDMVTSDGIFVKAIPFPSSLALKQDLITFYQLWRYFSRNGFHIVHTHMIKPGLLGRLAARLAGVPVVVHTIHGFHFHDEMSPVKIKFYSSIERFGTLFSDMMLSQNREDMKTAIGMKICKPDMLKFLGNGIDINRFHPSRIHPQIIDAKRKELGIDPGKKVVGMLARVVREKGYYEYLQALKILRERGLPVLFLAVGFRHYKKGAIDPMAMAQEMGLNGHFQYLGTRDDIPDFIAALDLVVLASWAEGIPRNLMEAAAMGKPVVATDVRGTRETVIHGKTGLLVPVKDSLSLADAIEEMLYSPEKAQGMGLAARKHAEEMFDEREYFKRTDKYYRWLLQNKMQTKL